MNKNILEMMNIKDFAEFKSLTGLNSPSKIESLSGIYIIKAGTKHYPDGFSYDAGKTPHWEWLAVLDGEMEILWCGRKTKIRAGDCYLMPPDIFLKAVPKDCSPLLTWIEFTGPSADEIVKCLNYDLSIISFAKYDLNTLKCSLAISKLLHERPAGYSFSVHSTFWRFLGYLHKENVSANGDISSGISALLEHIDENFRLNLTIEQMAEIAQMKLETFRKRFTAEIGMPPLQYLQKRKVAYSKELMADSTLKIKEISMMSGLKDPYYFSRLFKQFEGVSPEIFRKSFYPEFFN